MDALPANIRDRLRRCISGRGAGRIGLKRGGAGQLLSASQRSTGVSSFKGRW